MAIGGKRIYQEYGRAFGQAGLVFDIGMGIAWLHLRLDSRPKYYQFQEFAQEK